MSEVGGSRASVVRVVVAWLIVLGPLVWGVWETARRAMALFRE
jgi:hypothetical protein